MFVELAAKKNFFITFLTLLITSAIGYFMTLSLPLVIRLSTIGLLWIFVFLLQQLAPLYNAPLGSENLPAFVFAMLVASSLMHIKIIILSLIVIFGFILILRVYASKREPTSTQVFNISVIFATIAAFHPPLFILSVLLLYVFSRKLRNILIILVAYIFVLYVYFSVEIFLLKQPLSHAWKDLFDWHFIGWQNFFSPLWILVYVLFTISTVYAMVKMPTETIKNRKILWTTIIMTFVSWGCNLFSSTQPYVSIIFLLALLNSYFFYSLRLKPLFKDLFFLLIILISLALSLQLI